MCTSVTTPQLADLAAYKRLPRLSCQRIEVPVRHSVLQWAHHQAAHLSLPLARNQIGIGLPLRGLGAPQAGVQAGLGRLALLVRLGVRLPLLQVEVRIGLNARGVGRPLSLCRCSLRVHICLQYPMLSACLLHQA